jgi:predicted amidohydrolase YtcJ
MKSDPRVTVSGGATMLTILLAALATTLLAMVSSGIGQPAAPDLILLNGRVFTADASQPYVEALAVRGDRIVAVGTSANIGALAGAKTMRIDLAGRVVTPGFNDAHYHLRIEPPMVVLSFKGRDPQWDEIKAVVASAVNQAPKGALLQGDTGAALLDDSRVTRTALDALAPEHPVILRTWTGHSAFLNSAAFRMLGVKDDEPDPVGGRYVRASDGTLGGLVLGFARFRLARRLSKVAGDDKALQDTREFINQAVRFGITSVQVMSMPPSPERCLALFEKAPTPIRVRVIRFLLTNLHGRLAQEGRQLRPSPGSLVTVSGTKWVLDGTPIERTAAMREPYLDRPDTSGPMYLPETHMPAILRESLQNDDQLLLHIVGDRTIEAFLNAMDATGGRETWVKRRVRFEHADSLMPDLIPRAKALGIVVVQNPTHLGLNVKQWGPVRAPRNQPMHALLDAGIPLAIGSDGPNNPYLNLMLASTYRGKPGDALTREQAVIAYTATAAYAEFAEQEKGTLTPGKLADLAVLSQDIFRVPAEDLPKTVAMLTMVGGRIVYDAKVVSAR